MSIPYGIDQPETEQWCDEYGVVRGPADTTKKDETTGKEDRKSAATALVELAEELYEFGLSDTGETYAVPRSGPLVVRMLRGGKTSLRGQLSREYFRRVGKAAPQQALADALLVVEGMAQDTPETPLYMRVARHDGALWLDLGDATGRAVHITTSGWSVRDRAPILFKRTALTGRLPEPEPGADIAELWKWLNVTEPDRPLILAWLIAALYEHLPHPLLGLFGEHGTGKTTAEKILVSLIDPSPAPTRKPPRDADSWVTAATGSWIVGLDNLSAIPDWLSDSLCRAVTGEGEVRRRLYTDADMAVFAFRRALVLTGIDLGALRGDLADRLLPVTLEAIGEQDRRNDENLWAAWPEAHPRLLAALLDVAAGVAAALPSVRLASKPRMADFARILAAVDAVLGTDGLTRYRAKQGELATDSLTGDPFVTALAERGTTFTGTSAELLAELTPADEKWRSPRGWPVNARTVTQQLKRQAPVMRKAGWTVEHDTDGHSKVTRWTITPPVGERVRNPAPQHPQHPQRAVDQHKHPDSDAGHAAGHSGDADKDTRSHDRTSPQHPQTRDTVCAGQAASCGSAGHAGHEYGPSQDAAADVALVADPPEAEHRPDGHAPRRGHYDGRFRCRMCDHLGGLVGGLCTDCRTNPDSAEEAS